MAKPPENVLQQSLHSIWTVASAIGVAVGVLSVVLLFKRGFDIGFAAPLQVALEWYNDAVSALLTPLHPFATQAVLALSAMIGKQLVLVPEWKHMVMLTGVLTGAVLRSNAKIFKYFGLGVLAILFVLSTVTTEGRNDEAPLSPPVFVGIWLLAIYVSVAMTGGFPNPGQSATPARSNDPRAGLVERLGGVTPRRWGRSPAKAATSPTPARNPWAGSELNSIFKSTAIVFGGAALFIALNAGLRLIGM